MKPETLRNWGRPRVILVATNLGDTPGLALQAVSQARNTNAQLLLVHVIRPRTLRASLEPQPDSLITSARSAAAWDVLQRAVTLMQAYGVSSEPMVLEGDPVQEIARLAAQQSADRIVVATRSARGLSRLIEGSVAEGLIESAPVPVYVIGPRVVLSPFMDNRGGTVLLTLSLHHYRSAYLSFAAELARSRAAKLVLLHVLPRSDKNGASREQAETAARAELNQLMADVGLGASDASIELRDGAPGRGILDEPVCPSRDLIVMGGSSFSAASKLLGNSIVHQVIAEAACPVITLPLPGRREQNLQHASIRVDVLETPEIVSAGQKGRTS